MSVRDLPHTLWLAYSAGMIRCNVRRYMTTARSIYQWDAKSRAAWVRLARGANHELIRALRRAREEYARTAK